MATAQAEEFVQMEHRMLSATWIMFDLRWGVNLLEFVKTLDATLPLRVIDEVAQFGLTAKLPLQGIGIHTPLFQRACVAMRASARDRSLPMPPFLEESMMEVKPAQLKAFHVTMRDEVPVVIDTGASHSLTPFKEDFVDL